MSIRRSRLLIREVLDVLSKEASPPIFEDDVAMVTRFSIRSTSSFPLTPLTMKQQVLGLPPPTFRITSITPDFSGDVAAIVKGTWEAPDWRDGISIRRDSDGRPIVTSTKEVPFVIAIPKAAESAPVPMTFQLAFDPQDPHNHAAFMYANPLEVAGTFRKPSVLVQEGIADTLVPKVGQGAARSLLPDRH